MSHALTRFRERVDATATHQDLQTVLQMAKNVVRQWHGRGQRPGTPGVVDRRDSVGAVEVLLLWEGVRFRAIYVPHQEVLRTILPGW